MKATRIGWDERAREVADGMASGEEKWLPPSISGHAMTAHYVSAGLEQTNRANVWRKRP